MNSYSEINKNNNEKKVQDQIKLLEEKASSLLDMKKSLHQRRPIVIEFSGCPKSGKSSCINSLNLFLKRNGFTTKIITEKASICPMNDKLSPDFNIWTFCQTLSSYLEVTQQSMEGIDVILIDRGIFDSLCWFNYMSNKLNDEEEKCIKNFIMLDRWRRFTDLVFVFKTTTDISMKREHKNLLTNKQGSIMKESVLLEYYNAVEKTLVENEEKFHFITTVDTSDKDQNEVGFSVTQDVMSEIENMLIEKIASYDNSLSEILCRTDVKFCDIKDKSVEFSNRDIVEKSERIQPIAIGVLIDSKEQKVLKLTKGNKSLDDNSPEKFKSLLWAGGHIRKDDNLGHVNPFHQSEQLVDIELFKKALARELKEELGIETALQKMHLVEPKIIYTPDSEKSKRHFAVCFVIDIDSSVKLQLDKYEFTNKDKIKFVKISELKDTDNYESWSIRIAQEILNRKDIVTSVTQLSIFDDGFEEYNEK